MLRFDFPLPSFFLTTIAEGLLTGDSWPVSTDDCGNTFISTDVMSRGERATFRARVLSGRPYCTSDDGATDGIDLAVSDGTCTRHKHAVVWSKRGKTEREVWLQSREYPQFLQSSPVYCSGDDAGQYRASSTSTSSCNNNIQQGSRRAAASSGLWRTAD